MWAFDGARTHNLHITSQMCNPLHQASLCIHNVELLPDMFYF